MRAEEARIREGGGAKAVADAQRAKGRLTVRERLALLLDPEPLQVRASGRGPGAPGSVVVQGAVDGPLRRSGRDCQLKVVPCEMDKAEVSRELSGAGALGGAWDVCGVWRGSGGGGCHGHRARERAALHDRCE